VKRATVETNIMLCVWDEGEIVYNVFVHDVTVWLAVHHCKYRSGLGTNTLIPHSHALANIAGARDGGGRERVHCLDFYMK